MKISAIRSYKIANRNPFMGQSIESKPNSTATTEEFKRQEKNVFKILIPILMGGIVFAALLFRHKLKTLAKNKD